MGYTAKQLVAIAEAEIGYHEKASNAQLDSKTANSGNKNYQKYGRDLFKAGYYNGNKNGYDWCDQFVDWCFYQLCGKNKDKAEYIECQTGNLGAGCGYSMGYYKAAGRFDKTAKVGDQIFFKYGLDDSTADHTGIVVRVTDSLIETVEGNTGGEVKRKCYTINNATILGYGHPRYDAEKVSATSNTTKEVTTVNITLTVLKKGDKGAQVKTVQRLLRMMGYKDGNGDALEIDGSFGAKTLYALKNFQTKKGLTVDGIVGAKTWAKLLK